MTEYIDKQTNKHKKQQQPVKQMEYINENDSLTYFVEFTVTMCGNVFIGLKMKAFLY